MIIPVSRIPEAGATFDGVEPGEVLRFTPADEFRAAGPVAYHLYAQVVDEVLVVRGTLDAPLKAHCARCTQMFSTSVADSGFLRDYSGIQDAEEVDITKDIREAILLNLPRFPLCDEECKGLCPRCGKNLNSGPCGCSDRTESGLWSALDNLKL
jgi:uncharacterized protein